MYIHRYMNCAHKKIWKKHSTWKVNNKFCNSFWKDKAKNSYTEKQSSQNSVLFQIVWDSFHRTTAVSTIWQASNEFASCSSQNFLCFPYRRNKKNLANTSTTKKLATPWTCNQYNDFACKKAAINYCKEKKKSVLRTYGVKVVEQVECVDHATKLMEVLLSLATVNGVRNAG